MAALYLGLGIAMMTGISAMMQMGTNMNKYNIVSSFRDNYSSDLASKDREIMVFLNSYYGPESDVCSSLRQTLDESSYQPGPKFDDEGITETPSREEPFIGSCALVNTSIKHRVLIKKNEKSNTFSLFSCFLEIGKFDSPICQFEQKISEESE